MKKFLSSVSFSSLVLCLTAQLACAMKRETAEGEDERRAILRAQPQRTLEDVVFDVPDELWSEIFSGYIYGYYPFLLPLNSHKKNYKILTLVSKQWNKVATDIALKDFQEEFSDLFASNHASKLFILRIYDGSNITDEALKKLTNLTSLDFDGNTIITNEGIKNLTTLTRLSMRGTHAITGAGITGLTNLTNLDWGGVEYEYFNPKISGVEKLVNLTNLTVNVSFTNAELKNFTKLTFLDLENNTNITDEGIEDLINLKKLEIRGDSTLTGSGFKKLTNLTSLYCEPDNPPPLTNGGIRSLINLTYLRLHYVNNIGDEGIRGLTNLEHLDLQYHPSLTLDGVKDLPKLSHIHDSLMEIKDLKERAYTADAAIRSSIYYPDFNPLRPLDFLNPLNNHIYDFNTVAHSFISLRKPCGELIELLLELKQKYPWALDNNIRGLFNHASVMNQSLHREVHHCFNGS